MDDVIELENGINVDGFRVLRLMANVEIDEATLRKYGVPVGTPVETKREAGAFYLTATWAVCGVVEIRCEGWVEAKRFVMWHFSLCGSVRQTIYQAGKCYEELFGEQPRYAFIHKLPKDSGNGVVNGFEVGNLMLFEAEWMTINKCVAVGIA
jgi:hypothetical protein